MDKKEWTKIFRENKLNEGKTIDLDKVVDNWRKKHQKMYEDFLNKLLSGKSIKAKAMKYGDKGHNWKWYEINNIQKVEARGGSFFTELTVIDEDNKFYTLSKDKIEIV